MNKKLTSKQKKEKEKQFYEERYQTYRRYRNQLEFGSNKNKRTHRLREAKDINEFTRLYKGAKDLKMRNIARTLANNDLEISRDVAKKVLEASQKYLNKVNAEMAKVKSKTYENDEQRDAAIAYIQSKLDLFNNVLPLPENKQNKKYAKLSQIDIMNMDINIEEFKSIENTNYKTIEIGVSERQQLFFDMLGLLGREETYKIYGYGD